jgi:hypothetical protein
MSAEGLATAAAGPEAVRVTAGEESTMGRMPEPSEDPRDEPAADEDETEGHSLSLVMGLDALGRSRDRSRDAKPADEELTPITKTFPRLRDDRRK